MSEEQGAPTTESPRRGRPRPQETIDRDEKVYAVITGEGVTKAQVVAATDLTPNAVYLSLYRLRRDGYVQRVDGAGVMHTWRRVSSE